MNKANNLVRQSVDALKGESSRLQEPISKLAGFQPRADEELAVLEQMTGPGTIKNVPTATAEFYETGISPTEKAIINREEAQAVNLIRPLSDTGQVVQDLIWRTKGEPFRVKSIRFFPSST